MAKKKFYISDIPSVTNALNLMTSTYDKEFKNVHKLIKKLNLCVLMMTGCLYLETKIVKKQNEKIKNLEVEINNLKSKEGNQMTEGE